MAKGWQSIFKSARDHAIKLLAILSNQGTCPEALDSVIIIIIIGVPAYTPEGVPARRAYT